MDLIRKSPNKLAVEPTNELAGLTGHSPVPGSIKIPKWYGGFPLRKENEKKTKWDHRGQPANLTIKACNPVLDGFLTGYMVLLENDVEVSNRESQAFLYWREGGPELVTTHSLDQLPKEMLSGEYWEAAYKWSNHWTITPPGGYSLLFTHPLNRQDLPFTTMSGVVDADTYKNPVNFPFLLKKDFEGIIEAGTPIAQVIPIKRESWEMEYLEFSQKNTLKYGLQLRHKLERSYKRQFWNRKDYK